MGQQVNSKKSNFCYNYQYVSFQLLSFYEDLTALYNKISTEIMYEISAHFINYLRISTLPESTQTANAAVSTAPTGKKTKSNKYPRLRHFLVFFLNIGNTRFLFLEIVLFCTVRFCECRSDQRAKHCSVLFIIRPFRFQSGLSARFGIFPIFGISPFKDTAK